MIWAVPLSTVDLITHRLTPGHKSLAFGVYLKSVTHERAPRPNSALPPRFSIPRLPLKRFRREPAISKFVWNFTATHTSSQPFSTDTGSGLQCVLPHLHLDMGRSPGFGYITTYFIRPFQTRFRCGSGFSTLTLHVIMTRRFILQEARRHPLTGSDSL